MTPTTPTTPAGYGRDDSIVGAGTRSHDKRAGAVCDRVLCVTTALAAHDAGKTKTFRLSRTGNLAVKHDRGSTIDRARRKANLLEAQPTCAYCDGVLTPDTIHQDRIIEACEYLPKNLVAACSSCNNHRNSIEAKAASIEALATPTGAMRIAATIAAHPDFHAAS